MRRSGVYYYYYYYYLYIYIVYTTTTCTMVKVHKMFSIDHELVEWLKSVNASALVNDLLLKHKAKTDNPYLGLNEEELAHERALVELKMKYDKEREVLVNGRAEQVRTSR